MRPFLAHEANHAHLVFVHYCSRGSLRMLTFMRNIESRLVD
jgi:hypothetical protein